MGSPLDADRIRDLTTRARREIDEGLLPSCQFALAFDGEVIASETLGDATPDTLYCIFSATKGVVAGAVWMLIGDGLLDVASRVADLVPEFGTNGKEVVTVEQVLLHTGGFPLAPLGPPDWSDRRKRLEAFSKWRLNWEPGTRYEYHPTSGHWVLAEIIQRLSGEDHRDFIRSRITEPLGLTGFGLGLDETEQDGIAELEIVGEPPSPDELEAVLGVRDLDLGEVTQEALLQFNQPEARAVGVPGGGAFSRASDIALYYQALLHNAEGLWEPAVLRDGTTNARNLLPDPMTGVAAFRSLGLMLSGDDGKSAYRGMGHTVSSEAFGHNGAGGQIAFADRASGLSFCYLTNGLDANPIREARRSNGLASRAAVCRAGSAAR